MPNKQTSELKRFVVSMNKCFPKSCLENWIFFAFCYYIIYKSNET